MPRTKVSKSSKRNRETAIIEEKLREYHTCLENFLNDIDVKGNEFISNIEAKIKSLIERTNDGVLDAPFINILNWNVSKFSDYAKMVTNSSLHTATEMHSTKVSGNDDGYLTEESGNSVSNSAITAYLSMTQRGRNPGPFSSAHVRRQRRSRSACSDNLISVVSSKAHSRNVPVSEHASRNRLRTPMSARPKAFSADRSAIKNVDDNLQKSPACTFLRWPKPGECVVSVHGSPLIAQFMPDRFANVNIPIKDGVLSLRPKRLEDLDSKIVDKFDDETLHQIKTLHKNLDMIVSLASSKNLFAEKK